MPLRNQPHSLQKSSLVAIARNFDSICYNVKTRQEMCTMIYDESYLQVPGPFQHLPGAMLSDLLEVLVSDHKCRRLNRTHYHALIQPHLEHFKLASSDGEPFTAVKLLLTRCKVRDRGRIRRHHLHTLILPQLQEFEISSVGETILAVHLLTQRCRRLRRVNLSYLRNVGPGAMLRLATCLAEVTHLNLSMTQIIDQVLEVVGRCCPHLRELDVSNTGITDSALIRLSHDETSKVPQCQKLERVILAGCLLSPTGPAYLLHYLPRLYYIDYEYMFQVFEILQDWGVTKDNMTQCDPYPLRVLTSSSEHIDPSSVDVAVTLCPLVLEVTLSNAVIENELLYQTMRLEHLAHLRLTNCDGLSLNFHEGVLPVLTLRGHGLISLLLANFTVVDLTAIGECCPRLQNLALSGVTIYEEILYPRDHLFTTLVNLEVWTSVTTDSCNATILRQLLSRCPGLQNLLVRGADALSDKLLQELWQTNPMHQLSRLTLDSCHNVTIASIFHLLEEDNKLTLVRLWSCFLITRQDSLNLQHYVKAHNCDLYLEWYCWNG
ncbi:hypothetical protein GWK47_001705 [Chionoecetes opilio]|uniref:Uncharacterized protein n=1 Tax=Chionoecetes opilio TaxID=41210 RepID=A0A8J5CN60_CHIOP|nr:hypothetical protein GWK47_001705 [Chionoecetes opilio]